MLVCMHHLWIYSLLIGILFYRMQRNVRKRQLKLTHAGIMLFIVLLIVIALVAVFDSHNLAPTPIPNMYSLHSWVGLTTVILFCCQVNLWNLIDSVSTGMCVNLFWLQWVAGCVSFLFPGLSASIRSSYMPLHVYFGVAVFVSAIASCLLGLNEKAFFVLPLVAVDCSEKSQMIKRYISLFEISGIHIQPSWLKECW